MKLRLLLLKLQLWLFKLRLRLSILLLGVRMGAHLSDAFLIDRVFQPVVDRLSPFGNTYKIGKILLVTATLLNVACALEYALGADYVSVSFHVANALCYAFTIWGCISRIPPPRLGATPMQRFAFFPTRMIAMYISLMFLVGALIHPGWRDRLNLASDVAVYLWSAFWFVIACRNFPPPPPKPVFQFNALPNAV